MRVLLPHGPALVVVMMMVVVVVVVILLSYSHLHHQLVAHHLPNHTVSALMYALHNAQ